MQRNHSIDFIKGLAITGVVMGHTCAFPWASPFFNLWHMAAFFIIGGWFFNEKYWNGIGNVGMFCWKKVKRIWWPFVLWCSLFIVFHNFLMKIHVISENTDMVWKWLSADYYRMWSCRDILMKLPPVLLLRGNACHLGPLWFLTVMFFASIFYCLAGYGLTLIKVNRVIWLTIASLLALFFARYYYPRPLSIILRYVGGKHVLMAFPLIHLGYLLRLFHVDYSQLKGRTVAVLGATCFMVLWVLMSRGRIHYSRCQFPRICFMLMAALAGFYFAMALSYVPNISNFFAFIGKYTMSILLFHYMSYDIVDALRVMIRGLPWEYVSSFPIIAADWRWGICYVIAGVGAPIMLNFGWQKISRCICKTLGFDGREGL